MALTSWAPYKAAEPYRDIIETVGRNSMSTRGSPSERRVAALAVRKAVAGNEAAVLEGINGLNIAMMEPDKEQIRLILGMLSVFRSKPTHVHQALARLLY